MLEQNQRYCVLSKIPLNAGFLNGNLREHFCLRHTPTLVLLWTTLCENPIAFAPILWTLGYT
jgi:hypothetical protein